MLTGESEIICSSLEELIASAWESVKAILFPGRPAHPTGGNCIEARQSVQRTGYFSQQYSSDCALTD